MEPRQEQTKRRVYGPLDPPDRKVRKGGAPVWLMVVLLLLCVSLVFCCGYLINKTLYLESEVSKSARTISDLKERNIELGDQFAGFKNEISSLNDLIEECSTNFVVVSGSDSGEYIYHSVNCNYIADAEWRVCSISEAEAADYGRCAYCISFDFWHSARKKNGTFTPIEN